MKQSRAKPMRSLNADVERAAQQAIAPDRNQLASHRQLVARCGCCPAGEARRYAASQRQDSEGLSNEAGKTDVTLNGSLEGRSNNSFNASGISLDVIQLVGCLSQFFPPR